MHVAFFFARWFHAFLYVAGDLELNGVTSPTLRSGDCDGDATRYTAPLPLVQVMILLKFS
jgi:hypothetical protein